MAFKRPSRKECTTHHKRKPTALFLSIAALLITTIAIALSSSSSSINFGPGRRGGSGASSATGAGGGGTPPHHNLHDDHQFTSSAWVNLGHSTCNNTIYPSLFSTLSSSTTTTTKHHSSISPPDLAEKTISKTIQYVQAALLKIRRLHSRRPAVHDCVYMLDQTVHVLRMAVQELRHANQREADVDNRRYHGTSRWRLRRLRNLLSAAMTNQNSCLDGFDYEGQVVERRGRPHLKKYHRRLVTPIYRMVRNSLAIVKEMEEKSQRPSDPAMHRFPAWLPPRDRRLLIGLGRPRADVVVGNDGRGNYRTITEAVRAAPARSKRRFVIWIREGIYQENVEVPANKINLVFVGAGMGRTVITGNRSVADGSTTFRSATVAVAGSGFLARDLTIINTSGPYKGQAVALRVNADCSAFYKCNISGYQDTLYAHSLSQFYRDCTVKGTVDFIFGNAAAVFQNCDIQVLRPKPGQKNMVTAQGRDDPNQPTGISLHNCSITAAAAAAAEDPTGGGAEFETYLGRPWRRYSRTMVMGCYLGEVVHPKGWHEWSDSVPLDKVELLEYRNRGPGSSTKGRVAWARTNVTVVEAMQFAVGELIGGRWLNATAYPFYSGL